MSPRPMLRNRASAAFGNASAVSGSTVRAAAVSVGRDAARDRIRSALISAVYHAHRTSVHDRAPFFLQPMPLDEAVRVLANQTERNVRLHAAAWLLDNPAREDELLPYAKRLVERDGARLVALPKELPASISFDGAPQDIGTLQPTRFGYAYSALLQGACERREYRLHVRFDPYSLVTRVRAAVEVQRVPTDFQILADPRGWEDSAGLFFKESKLCNLAGGDFEIQPDTSATGSKAYNDLLIEHVCLGFSPAFPIEGINVLRVDCQPLLASPRFDVSLYSSLETKMGLSVERGGLDVDGGTFAADLVEPADPTGLPWTRVSGTKTARFTEREVFGWPAGLWVNRFAPFCLAPMMAALIYEGACA